MKQFQGRVVAPGEVTAEALVSTEGFNTLASFQMALQFGDKEVKCGDQNNKDLHGKPMIGKALCLPQTIGSTTGGLVLYCACALGKNPACMLFSGHIDSLAAAGAILADVWVDGVSMPVVDCLGEEFLAYVEAENHRTITVVSNPGEDNEKIETVQVAKGLLVSVIPYWEVEETVTLYLDADCTELFEGDWDADADLTVYAKWGE